MSIYQWQRNWTVSGGRRIDARTSYPGRCTQRHLRMVLTHRYRWHRLWYDDLWMGSSHSAGIERMVRRPGIPDCLLRIRSNRPYQISFGLFSQPKL